MPSKQQPLKSRVFQVGRKQGSLVNFGDGVKVLARSPSVNFSLALAKAQREGNTEAVEAIFVDAFIDVARDPDTGDAIFGPDDRDDVLALPSEFIMQVLQAAGLAPNVEAATKN